MVAEQLIEYREALRQAMNEEMARDSRVFLIGEEVGAYNGPYKVSKGMLEMWGSSRVIDTPIAELGFSGLAVGAAMTGLKPIVEFMSFSFSFVAIDQILSNASTMHYMSGDRFTVPVVFRGPNGAAAQVSSQHSHCVEAIYARFPGLIVITPSTPYNAKGLLKSAIRANAPVIFLENELGYGDKMMIPTSEYLVSIGEARIARPGKDVSLITYGSMVKACVETAVLFGERSIEIEVVDLQTIRPLDLPLILDSIAKTHRCVIVEPGYSFCGISAEISAQIAEHAIDQLDAPIIRVGQKPIPMPYSKALEALVIPNVQRIVEAIEQVLA